MDRGNKTYFVNFFAFHCVFGGCSFYSEFGGYLAPALLHLPVTVTCEAVNTEPMMMTIFQSSYPSIQ